MAVAGRLNTVIRLTRSDGFLGLIQATVNFYLIRRYIRLEPAGGKKGDGPSTFRLVGRCPHVFCDSALDLPVVLESLCALHYEKVPGFSPSNGFTIVDVGANIGAYTLRAATRMRSGRIIAIEPNPVAFLNLQRNVETIRKSIDLKIELHEVGVSSRPAGLYPFNPGGLSMLGRFLDGSGQDDSASLLHLPCEPLDHICSGLGRVDVLKIDVEGAELDVLESACKTLQSTGRVVLEYHSDALLGQVRCFLSDKGFELAGLFPNGRYELGLAFFIRPEPGPLTRF